MDAFYKIIDKYKNILIDIFEYHRFNPNKLRMLVIRPGYIHNYIFINCKAMMYIPNSNYLQNIEIVNI